MNRLSAIDLHCDTLQMLYLKKSTLRDWQGQINLQKLLQGDAALQCFAIFIPTHASARHWGVAETPYSYVSNVMDLFAREMAAHADVLRPVRSAADIEENRREGLISAMLTVEDGVAVEGSFDRLREFYDRGVRMLTLTWNYENCFGYPNSSDPEKHALGLKPFGIEALSLMNDLGMIIDVSHLSEGGFRDVAYHSKKPFAASHSCARALVDHPRNLTDQQLRTLGDCGGVCGVNFYNLFLRGDGGDTTVEDIVRHMKHIANVAGVDAVALGSDFDGINDALAFRNYAGMPQIAEGISKAFTPTETEKILRGNALRLFRDVIG